MKDVNDLSRQKLARNAIKKIGYNCQKWLVKPL